MKYIIFTKSKNGKYLFLANKDIIKDKYWTENLEEAVKFYKFDIAEKVKNKKIYNDPTVISEEEAKYLNSFNKTLVLKNKK